METRGAIGFAEQRAALEAVLPLLPEGAKPVLMGDRFYGSPAVIAWCRDHGWDWRLRLKQDLLVFEDGGETILAECFARGEHMLTGIKDSHIQRTDCTAPGFLDTSLSCGGPD